MPQAIIESARAEALFVTMLQRSDGATTEQIRAAVTDAVRRYGTRGCAARVAHEFGEHPDTAVMRMRWALDATRTAFPAHRATVHSLTVHRRPLASSPAA